MPRRARLPRLLSRPRHRTALAAASIGLVLSGSLAPGLVASIDDQPPAEPRVADARDAARAPTETGEQAGKERARKERARKAPLSRADRRMAAKLRVRVRNGRLGRNVTGRVLDVRSGRTVWSDGGRKELMPASTAKVGTAVAALQALGPNRRLTTEVRTSGRTITIVGGGDALLTGRDLSRLAARTARSVKRGVSYRVRVDDTLFAAPRLSPGWSPGYYTSNVTPVRSLVVDERQVMDTAMDAGRIFAQRLRDHGLRVVSTARGEAPDGARTVARCGTPVCEVVIEMLLVSDNDLAESLQRLTAVETGRPATWRGGARAQLEVLRRLGVETEGMRLYDGSGLSRSDRVSAAHLTSILRAAYAKGRHRRMWPLKVGLPVAGTKGTLHSSLGRFTTPQSRAATGQVKGKTGSLHDVVTLAGVTRGADGDLLAYAFMQNGSPSTLSTKQAFDGLAATVHGSW
ncbi:D-alanyl-D-alanine carboxypeptidase/D-alanyl-D-alanine endopeptidase [Nocardioides pantholopis]|uniref:D-alanyl-D-alanine carboxypeptidase/D-alanyl-D-alanine endopeptidase n=1 Tax=Nocardioides pantholopis TaxID=2483798 RepID=UPI0013E30C92|nr:D-alanyl-D-alanine carboxypeptidase/D-alanyl-D-alanine-endopeptidase [Nocardioides pantholopis]